jgi:hypothetical protein
MAISGVAPALRLAAVNGIAAFALLACSTAPPAQLPALGQAQSASHQRGSDYAVRTLNLSGETLSSTNVAIHTNCFPRGTSGPEGVSDFRAAGTAKGPFAGTFTASGDWQFDRQYGLVSFYEKLVIRSGSRRMRVVVDAPFHSPWKFERPGCHRLHLGYRDLKRRVLVLRMTETRNKDSFNETLEKWYLFPATDLR